MNNKDKIDRIDEVLAQCEDILHGDIGESVTEARKLLSQLATNYGSADVSDILQKERFRIFKQLLIEEQENAFSRKVEVDTDDLYNVIFKNGTIEP